MDRFTNRLLKILLLLIIGILFFVLFPRIKNLIFLALLFLLPFIIGFIIAFVFNPLVTKLEKLKVKRVFSSILIVFIILIGIVLLFVFITPTLIKEVSKLINNLPSYINNLNEIIKKICNKLQLDSSKVLISSDKILEMLKQNLNNFFIKIVKIFQSIFSYITGIGITIVLSLYFLIQYHSIIETGKNFLIKKKKEDVFFVFQELDVSLRAYFRGVFIIMIIMIIISTIAFKIIGLDLSLLWGVIIGVTNIIPYVGPLIGGFIVILFTLGTAINKFIPVLVYIILIQFLESNFLTPQIESKCVKTHPIIVIFFVTLLGNILGIIGMFLAIPLISIIQVILKYKKIN